jgi:hypothetical protein
VQPTVAGVLRLVRALNELCDALPAERVQETVEVWWPRLDEELRGIRESTAVLDEKALPQRSADDMLAELLELTRGLQRELQKTRTATLTQQNPELAWHQQVMHRLVVLAADQGFEATDISRLPELVDLKLTRGGCKLYVEVSRSRNLSLRVRETLRRLRLQGLDNPLLFVAFSPIPDSLLATLPPNVRMVQWQAPEDDKQADSGI